MFHTFNKIEIIKFGVIFMTIKRLFGTFGVRRIANQELTPEFASKLAAAYGSLVKGTVAVGGDPRTSTEMIKHSVIAGLLSSGCDVVDLGILPTPTVQFAVRNYYDGGVMITASHNPPKYNGLKFVVLIKMESLRIWRKVLKICSLMKILKGFLGMILEKYLLTQVL